MFINDLKKENLLQGITFCGMLDHKSLIKEIDTSTCLIHPSLEETFGNILLEGMARCLPVIGGMNSGAVPFVLGKGEFGILCDVNDVNSIVNAMKMSEDTSKCACLVQKATDNLIKNYRSDSITYQHLALYEKYINKQKTDSL